MNKPNTPNRRPRYVHRQRAEAPLHPLRNRVRAELGQEMPPLEIPMPSTAVSSAQFQELLSDLCPLGAWLGAREGGAQ